MNFENLNFLSFFSFSSLLVSFFFTRPAGSFPYSYGLDKLGSFPCWLFRYGGEDTSGGERNKRTSDKQAELSETDKG